MPYNLSILNLITAILGFVVFGLLIFSSEQNRFVNFFLGIGFFSIAYRSLSIYALQRGLVSNTFLMGSVTYVNYFIGPSVYLYFRSVVNDEQSLKKKDWIHFLAPALAIVLLLYYLTEGYIKYERIILPVNQTPFNNITGFNFYVQPGYHALLVFFQCAFYLALSWGLVIKKLRRTFGEHLQLQKVRSWVLTLLITFTLLLLVLFFGAIIKLIFNLEFSFFVDPDIARSLILVFIFTRVLFKTDLLYGIPHLETQLPIIDFVPSVPDFKEFTEVKPDIDLSEPELYKIVNAESVDREVFFDKYGWIQSVDANGNQLQPPPNSASIEKDKVIFYIQKINQYLDKAPYTDENFDIKSISTELKAPLYHIEYLFRYYNKYSFSEFRNVMRVQCVLKELESGVPQNYTIEAIGLKAGFNSRSSFFRVFKAVTGKTPKQVLEEKE